MDQLVIPKVSDAVSSSFEPVMKALGPVRRTLAPLKDVVTVRPGYSYPDDGKPVPALVVAVTPGTAPVKANELANRFARGIHGDGCHGRGATREAAEAGRGSFVRNARGADHLDVRENVGRR